MADPLVFVLGGTRSGKSAHALDRIRALAPDGRAWFLATAWRGDPELERRIERHRRARPASWPTVDVEHDLAAAIDRCESAEPVIVEGLTLWLSTVAGDDLTDPDPILDGPMAATLDAIDRHAGPLIVVSDEIGHGSVPMHAGARAYRDLVGLAHQRLAAVADEVVYVVAGLPLVLKDENRR
jgi:adenosyl cobinamide kinase/adenosyl cobinamide phosphate guanylyltransferase